MEVKIGIHESPKEITVELEGDADAIIAEVEEAVSADDGMLWLTDKKGRKVGVPADRVAYVEISPDSDKPVGFGR